MSSAPWLAPEVLAESRAHAAIRERDERRAAAAGTKRPRVDALLERLDRTLGRERVAFLRDEFGHWEARTMSGDAGHGDSLVEALGELLVELST